MIPGTKIGNKKDSVKEGSELTLPFETSTELTTMDDIDQFRERLEGFMKFVHKDLKPKEIQTHKMGFKYVPISVIENKLDTLFFGLWQDKNFRWEVVANEVVGTIDLYYFHPVINQWMQRTGAGAVQIRFTADANLTDISKKIKTALQMDFPHLKAECIKNAALSIGESFGRNLRRDYTAEYVGIVSNKTIKLNTEQKDYLFNAENNIPQYTKAGELKKQSKAWIEDAKKLKIPEAEINKIAELIQSTLHKIEKGV